MTFPAAVRAISCSTKTPMLIAISQRQTMPVGMSESKTLGPSLR
jgi:hypothetical protein